MKKNDKLIVVLGVLILILASIGVYYYDARTETLEKADIEHFYNVCGVMSDKPNAIIVPDSCAFYPLVATPLAVNYDKEGNQFVAPLYVENAESPSEAVKKVRSLIGSVPDLMLDESITIKDTSIKLAKDYWKRSSAALLIEDSQEGYNLGIIATPIASYLSIPVIITDEVDNEVKDVLNNLGVTKTIVCGDNIEGYGKVLKFDNVDDVVNASMDLTVEKFGEVDYISITNPIDAYPPKVLDNFTEYYGPITIQSGASTRIVKAALSQGGNLLGKFTIPEDYKYALIKFEGKNLDFEDVDDFGDYVSFTAGANLEDIPATLQKLEAFSGATHTGGVAERDANGNLICDKVYGENVLYGRGGVEYTVSCKGQWMIRTEGRASAKVTVEKLEHPQYSLMKQISSLAPYLTAYHKGIVFGKTDFAFTADDDVLTDEGEPSPGCYVPRRNPRINDKACKHIYDNIHEPLNDILAKLAGMELNDERDIKRLREYYDEDPVYIALVGGPMGVPNYIYQNYLEKVDYWEGQYGWGVGTPSDVIYGNIDPTMYDWSNLAQDVFTQYPYQENIVGRITGWDAQDASALIARSVFYNEVVEKLDEWKDSMAILVGDGQDFRQPVIRYPIANLFGATHRGEPMKMWTGYGEIILERMVEEISKPLGFTNIYTAYKEPASRVGYSTENLKRIQKETSLLNKFFFWVRQAEKYLGDKNIKGGEMMENSNFIFINGHGNSAILAMDGIELTAAGLAGPVTHYILKKVLEVVSPYTGPASSLSAHIQYTTREVARMDLGPSFMWLESCICGKIDGVYPTQSLGQAFLHSGLVSLVASPTGSNIAGGYLEPKKRQSDTPFSVFFAYLKSKMNARKGIYPEPHFGFLIYTDMVNDMENEDDTVGMAFRDAKNRYLPQDADWELWWSPPLIKYDDFLDTSEYQETYYENMRSEALEDPFMMKNKYTSFQEYLLFGDPALNLYIPE